MTMRRSCGRRGAGRLIGGLAGGGIGAAIDGAIGNSLTNSRPRPAPGVRFSIRFEKVRPHTLLVAVIAGALLWLRTLSAPLDSLVQGGQGLPSTVVSAARLWLARRRLAPVHKRVLIPAEHARVVFPQAPLRGPFTGSAGWWWLNLTRSVAPGEKFADYSAKDPGGIAVALEAGSRSFETRKGSDHPGAVFHKAR